MPLPNIPKLALSRNQIIIAGGVLLIIVAVALLFWFNSSSTTAVVPVKLTVWGTDPKTAFETVVADYEALRPNVTITYVQVPAENYDDTLLNALAAGKGPDVFMVGNHDILKRLSLLTPASVTQISSAQVDQDFPTAAGQDFVLGGKVYALPLYMDTLSLVYNKDSFDQAGIATPPATWQDFETDILKLRALSSSGQILKAAAAIGSSAQNVRHAADLLNLLMIQNGVQMADADGKAVFAGSNASTNALNFYLQFADSGSPFYTWSDNEPDSLESFLQGATAMAFAYASDIDGFKEQSPFLDFGTALMPQVSLDHAVNYPNYQGLAVALRSAAPEWGWDFITYAALNSDAAQSYLATTKRTPALRTLLATAVSNGDLFSKAALTARSWPMPDYVKVQDIFNNAITGVTTGASSPEAALNRAEGQINQL